MNFFGNKLVLVHHVLVLSVVVVQDGVAIVVADFCRQMFDRHGDLMSRSSYQIGVDEKVDEEYSKQSVECGSNEHHVERSIAGHAQQFQLQCLVIDEQPDEHLRYLQRGYGQANLFGHIHACHLDGVISVHQGVHKKVHVDHPSGGGWGVGENEPRVVESEQVVDPVQGDQTTFAKQNEGRVKKFNCLRQGEE